MSLKQSGFAANLKYPIMYGSLFLGAYIMFTNRRKLMGNLESQRDVLFVEDKEARTLLETAIRDAQKS